MECPERIRLVEEYAATTSALFIAVSELLRTSGLKRIEAKEITRAGPHGMQEGAEGARRPQGNPSLLSGIVSARRLTEGG